MWTIDDHKTRTAMRGTPDGRASPPPTKVMENRKREMKQALRQFLKDNPKVETFLKSKHAYGNYIKSTIQHSLKTETESGSKSFFKEKISRLNDHRWVNTMYDVINLSMIWDETTEGQEYWWNLARKGQSLRVK